MNDLFLVCAISKKDDHGQEIYFLKNNNAEVLQEEGTAMPIFIVEQGGDWLRYSNEREAFNMSYEIPAGFEPENVKIMACRHFEIKEGQIREIPHPITADYDELMSASIKRIPFELNEQIPTQFTREVFNSFLALLSGNFSSTDAEERIIQGIANLIYKYEEHEKSEHRDRVFLPQMGVVNLWELAGKVYLKDETAGATSHGPETNNPWPEPMNPGNYVAYLPERRTIILKNEQEICDFINEKRKEGFPLDVNPKWGWDIDENGRLFIPQHRLDWNRVREQLEALKISLLGVKTAQRELLERWGLKYSEHNIKLLTAPSYNPEELEYLENYHDGKSELHNLDEDSIQEFIENGKIVSDLYGQYVFETELVNLKVTMEKLRLEPNSVYNSSSQFSPAVNSLTNNPSICNAVIKIMTYIHDMDLQKRQSMFNLYSATFINRQREFTKQFEKNSIIVDEIISIQDQIALTKVQRSHTSSASSMRFSRD